MKDKKFTFFESYHKALSRLSDEHYGRIVRAISKFVFDGEEPDFSEDTDCVIWELTKPIIERGFEISNARREANLSRKTYAGGAPLGNSHSSKQQQTNKNIGDWTNLIIVYFLFLFNWIPCHFLLNQFHDKGIHVRCSCSLSLCVKGIFWVFRLFIVHRLNIILNLVSLCLCHPQGNLPVRLLLNYRKLLLWRGEHPVHDSQQKGACRIPHLLGRCFRDVRGHGQS